MLNWDNASEQDVREELLAPLLKKLGYKRGTSNDLIREKLLKYDSISLGRKKKKDLKLLGRADYILKVVGGKRWVLEAKPPHEEICEESIAQALSYARHPEVSAVYAAICNGVRFVLFCATQAQNETPLLDIAIEDNEQLFQSLAATLSPNCIRRSFKPPKVSADRALSNGLQSSEEFEGGFVRFLDAKWETNISLPILEKQKVEESIRRLSEYESAILGGNVQRNADGRIIAKFNWAAPHSSIIEMAEKKGLMEISHICLDDEISTDPSNPSIFDFAADIEYSEGEELFDIVQWTTSVVEIAAKMRMTGQAMGVIQDQMFIGFFDAHYYLSFPAQPDMWLNYMLSGTFEVYLRD